MSSSVTKTDNTQLKVLGITAAISAVAISLLAGSITLLSMNNPQTATSPGTSYAQGSTNAGVPPPSTPGSTSTGSSSPPISGIPLNRTSSDVTWVYFETDKYHYQFSQSGKDISVTVFGTIRTTTNQKIELFLIGPINDNNTEHKQIPSDKPFDSTYLSRTEFPQVGSFAHPIRISDAQAPYHDEYKIIGRYGNVLSPPVYFYID